MVKLLFVSVCRSMENGEKKQIKTCKVCPNSCIKRKIIYTNTHTHTLKTHLTKSIILKFLDGEKFKQNVIYSFIAMRIN